MNALLNYWLLQPIGGQPRLILDCREVRRPGTARLPTRPDVPSGLIVLSYEPRELTVTFIAKGKEEGPP